MLAKDYIKKKSGEMGRCEGYRYEKELAAALNRLFPDIAREAEQSVLSRFDGYKTTSKADIVINEEPCSIKNPGRSSSSIQIMVTSAENFFLSLGTNAETMNSFRLFFGLHEGFPDLLRENKIENHRLSYDSELRRQRLKFSSLPSGAQKSLLSFLNKNKRDIVEVVFRQGWAKESKHHASKMIWCDSSAAGKSSVDNLCLFDMGEVIEKICQHTWQVRKSETVIELGPLTLQMKGSGKGRAYHYPQFNTSLNDLQRFGISCIEGNCEKILECIVGVN